MKEYQFCSLLEIFIFEVLLILSLGVFVQIREVRITKVVVGWQSLSMHYWRLRLLWVVWASVGVWIYLFITWHGDGG